MKLGDIVFFPPDSKGRKLNVESQKAIASARRSAAHGKWYHVAICVEGPLVLHAMPTGGVHLEIRQEESTATLPVFRPRAPIDADSFRKACVYFLGEKYQVATLWRYSANSPPGFSACSILVQKVFKRLGIEPFTAFSQGLLPIELFERLASSKQWIRMEAPITGYEDAVTMRLDTDFRRELFVREKLELCTGMKDALMMQVETAQFNRLMSITVSNLHSTFDRIFLEDAVPPDMQPDLLWNWRGDKRIEMEEPLMLGYRAVLKMPVSAKEIEAIGESLASNWDTARHDLMKLPFFSAEARRRRCARYFMAEALLNKRLFEDYKEFSTLMMQSDFTEATLLPVIKVMRRMLSRLQPLGVTSNAALSHIIEELKADVSALEKSEERDAFVISVLNGRAAVLRVLKEELDMLGLSAERFVVAPKPGA